MVSTPFHKKDAAAIGANFPTLFVLTSDPKIKSISYYNKKESLAIPTADQDFWKFEIGF